MSRKLRSLRGHTDSLDLLLGPMCNTFGGIVLMAVALTLLSREVDLVSTPTSASATGETTEMLARRVAKAEDDLAQAQAFHNSLEERTRDPALAERVRLAAERLRLRQTLNALQQAPRGTPSADIHIDPGLIAGQLHTELAALTSQEVELENARSAIDENLARLQQRQNDLAAQTQNEKDNSTKKLRLPKERTSGKTPFFVILRYGQVYPRAIFRDGIPEENHETIKRTSDEDDLLLEPRAGMGLNPEADKATIDTLLRAVPAGSYYLVFVVYEDSFPAFNILKQRASEMGLDFGWDPYSNNQSVIFTKHGSPPPSPL